MTTLKDVKRIERVLRLRNFEERLRRQEWAAAMTVETDAASGVELARADVAALEAAMRKDLASGRVAPDRLLDLRAAQDAAVERVDRAVVALDRARRDRTAKESNWREARKRALALERLRERRLERHKDDEARLERKETDEVALGRFIRSRATHDVTVRS